MTQTHPHPATPHIFIGTPTFGGMVTQTYMQSVIACMTEAQNFDFTMTLSMIGNDALITRCRNTMVHQFLSVPQASHLLFIDSDIGFTAADINRLLSARKDVIGGLYPLKEHFWDEATAANVALGEPPQTASLRYVGEAAGIAADPAPRQRVAFAGTGFLMISRAAILRMIAAYPETRYRRIDAPNQPAGAQSNAALPAYALFDCTIDPATGTYLSEDFSFCARWRAAGGEVWIDRTLSLIHDGRTVFQGDPAQRARQAATRPRAVAV